MKNWVAGIFFVGLLLVSNEGIASRASVVSLEGARPGCTGTFLNATRDGDILVTSASCLGNLNTGNIAILKEGKRIWSSEVTVHPYLREKAIADPTRVAGLLDLAVVKFPSGTSSAMSPIASNFIQGVGGTFLGLFHPMFFFNGLSQPVVGAGNDKESTKLFQPGTGVYDGKGNLLAVSSGCEKEAGGDAYGCTAVSLHDQTSRETLMAAKDRWKDATAEIQVPDTRHELCRFGLFRPRYQCAPSYCPPVYYPAHQPAYVHVPQYHPAPQPVYYFTQAPVRSTAVAQAQSTNTNKNVNNVNPNITNTNTFTPTNTNTFNPTINFNPKIVVSPAIQNNNGTGNSNSNGDSDYYKHKYNKLLEDRLRQEDRFKMEETLRNEAASKRISEAEQKAETVRVTEQKLRLEAEQRAETLRQAEEKRRLEAEAKLSQLRVETESALKSSAAAQDDLLSKMKSSHSAELEATKELYKNKAIEMDLKSKEKSLENDKDGLEIEQGKQQSRLNLESKLYAKAQEALGKEEHLLYQIALEKQRRQLEIIAAAQSKDVFLASKAKSDKEVARVTKMHELLKQPAPSEAMLASLSGGDFDAPPSFLVPKGKEYLGVYAKAPVDAEKTVKGLETTVASAPKAIPTPTVSGTSAPVIVRSGESPYVTPGTAYAKAGFGKGDLVALIEDKDRPSTTAIASATPVRMTLPAVLLTVFTLSDRERAHERGERLSDLLE